MSDLVLDRSDFPDDPGGVAVALIKNFQRLVRIKGIPIECDAFCDRTRIRGRVTKLTEDQIRVRLLEPLYWRIMVRTWVEWRFTGYRPFDVDLSNRSVGLSDRAQGKAEFLLRLAWIRAKHSAATGQGTKKRS